MAGNEARDDCVPSATDWAGAPAREAAGGDTPEKHSHRIKCKREARTEPRQQNDVVDQRPHNVNPSRAAIGRMTAKIPTGATTRAQRTMTSIAPAAP